jgi:glycosyltransferase involved in cell wall biosynthesis
MAVSQTTWIVVPAFNEGEVLREVLQSLLREGYRVVVVDDGSSDATIEQLADLPVHCCRHVFNLGQGAALQTGIDYALEMGASFTVTFDADGQHRAEDVGAILEPLVAGKREVTLGSRFLKRGGAPGIPAVRRVLLRSGAMFSRIALGLQVTDMHNGLRGFTAAAARKLEITQNRMAHATQILRQIRRHGLSYQEVPVTIRYTEYSMGKGQTLSNLLNVLWESCFKRK